MAGIDDAAHAEYGPGGTPVISGLACSLDGQQITVELMPDTRLAALHPGTARVVEFTTCNYGLAPGFDELATSYGMRVAGAEADGEVRAVERTDHPFFLATLYQPQLRTTAADPHPVFLGLLRAAR
jgi:CTP synthase (UTP-ammonia lyase)